MERETVGSFLRTRRVAQGRSISGLALRAGVSKSALSTWERDLRRPCLPELDAVLVALQVSAEDRARALALVDAPRAYRELRRLEPGGLPPSAVSGDLLRALRLRRGLSLAETAEAVGVNPSAVSRWENGDTWPSPDRMAATLAVLGAHPEERAALLSSARPLHPLPLDDLGAGEAKIDEIQRHVFRPHTGYLVELELVGLLSRVWPSVGRSDGARRLYGWGCGVFACHLLVRRGALDAAARYAHRALEHLPGDESEKGDWAVHALAKHAAFGGGRRRPEAGVEYLQPWLPRARNRPHIAAWFARDIADFLSEAGELEPALRLSSEARERATLAGHGLHHANFDHACLLLRAGRPGEALPFLPTTLSQVPVQQARERLAWAESLMGVGERDHAAQWLETATRLIESEPLDVLRPRLRTFQRLGG